MAAHEADDRHTRAVAAFVSGLRYESIPDEVRARIKLLVLDSLGCALYGADRPWTRTLRQTLAAVDATRTVSVWGTAERLSAPHAALVNGTSVQGFALDPIRARRPFSLDELDRVVVMGSRVTADHVGWPYRPEGLTSAQLNLPFCLATLLIEGDAFVDQFHESCVEDAARIALSRKVEVREDPAITALGSKFRHKVHVEVRFADGTVERETREAPRGSETSFGSEADIVAKFRKLSASIIDERRQSRLVEAVLGMERLRSSAELIELLSAEGG